ncbi:hypothetical protein CWI36_1866p0020, partial [Hamiltosporidium magnivora]
MSSYSHELSQILNQNFTSPLSQEECDDLLLSFIQSYTPTQTHQSVSLYLISKYNPHFPTPLKSLLSSYICLTLIDPSISINHTDYIINSKSLILITTLTDTLNDTYSDFLNTLYDINYSTHTPTIFIPILYQLSLLISQKDITHDTFKYVIALQNVLRIESVQSVIQDPIFWSLKTIKYTDIEKYNLNQIYTSCIINVRQSSNSNIYNNSSLYNNTYVGNNSTSNIDNTYVGNNSSLDDNNSNIGVSVSIDTPTNIITINQYTNNNSQYSNNNYNQYNNNQYSSYNQYNNNQHNHYNNQYNNNHYNNNQHNNYNQYNNNQHNSIHYNNQHNNIIHFLFFLPSFLEGFLEPFLYSRIPLTTPSHLLLNKEIQQIRHLNITLPSLQKELIKNVFNITKEIILKNKKIKNNFINFLHRMCINTRNRNKIQFDIFSNCSDGFCYNLSGILNMYCYKIVECNMYENIKREVIYNNTMIQGFDDSGVDIGNRLGSDNIESTIVGSDNIESNIESNITDNISNNNISNNNITNNNISNIGNNNISNIGNISNITNNNITNNISNITNNNITNIESNITNINNNNTINTLSSYGFTTSIFFLKLHFSILTYTKLFEDHSTLSQEYEYIEDIEIKKNIETRIMTLRMLFNTEIFKYESVFIDFLMEYMYRCGDVGVRGIDSGGGNNVVGGNKGSDNVVGDNKGSDKGSDNNISNIGNNNLSNNISNIGNNNPSNNISNIGNNNLSNTNQHSNINNTTTITSVIGYMIDCKTYLIMYCNSTVNSKWIRFINDILNDRVCISSGGVGV